MATKRLDNPLPSPLPLSLPAGTRLSGAGGWIACTVPVLRDDKYFAIWLGPTGARHNTGFSAKFIDWKSTR